MGFFVFGRFHAREGREEVLTAALLGMADKTRAEPGCLTVEVFRSDSDPRQFLAHAHWQDLETFEAFANKPYAVSFTDHLLTLIDHQLDLTRAHAIAGSPSGGGGGVCRHEAAGTEASEMSFFVFCRFVVRRGQEDAVAAALQEMVGKTRAEPECLAVDVFQSTQDPQLFLAQTCWRDEEAFEAYIRRPSVVSFADGMIALTEHQFDITPARAIIRSGA